MGVKVSNMVFPILYTKRIRRINGIKPTKTYFPYEFRIIVDLFQYKVGVTDSNMVFSIL